MSEKKFLKTTTSIAAPRGWVCPECGYVWAPWVAGCKNCNREEATSSLYPYSEIETSRWKTPKAGR